MEKLETIKTSHDQTSWITNLVSSRYISNVTRILRWQENWLRLPTKWKFIWFAPFQPSFEAMNFFLVFSVFPAYLKKSLIASPSPTSSTAIDSFFLHEILDRVICATRKYSNQAIYVFSSNVLSAELYNCNLLKRAPTARKLMVYSVSFT